METLKILFRESGLLIACAVLFGFFSAFLNIVIIHSIAVAINHRFVAITSQQIAVFSGLLLLAAFTNILSQGILVRMGQWVVYRLRKMIVDRILATDYEQLEKLGGHRLYASITGDIDDISNAFNTAPLVIVNIVISIAGLAYLGFLSLQLFAFVVAILIVGIFIFETILNILRKFIKLAREEQDRMHKHYESIISGAKELKLNLGLQRFFHGGVLLETLAAFRRLNTRAQLAWVLAFNWSQFLFLAILALSIIAGTRYFSMPAAVLTGYVLTILFLRTPVGIVVDFMPALSRGGVALKKIAALQLNTADSTTEGYPDKPVMPRSFESIKALAVEYKYSGSDAEHNFHLGPVSLDIYPGQIIFLAGGNGSGKSTLAKLLMGLYRPHQGTIAVNGENMSAQPELLRNCFSVVFSDLYLFDYILDAKGALAGAENILPLLEKLDLAHCVKIENGKLSTTRLSQGQRKRLGLLAAYMANRPIFLFDEWAADQDPHFKDYFYNEVLVGLKAKGKAVIVISHDDRYFGVADRIYKLENGRLCNV